MTNSETLAFPAKAHSSLKKNRRTGEPMALAKRAKKLLGIPERSEPTNDDEPYFGL